MKYTHTPTCMIISLFKLVFEHRAFRAGRCGCPRKGYMRTAQMLRIPRVLPRRRACARQIAPCRAVAEKEDAHQHACTRVVVKVCLRMHPHHRACARAAVNCLGERGIQRSRRRRPLYIVRKLPNTASPQAMPHRKCSLSETSCPAPGRVRGVRCRGHRTARRGVGFSRRTQSHQWYKRT